MILVPGKNPMGNVIHAILGPETDLMMDVQGSTIMEIGALLNKFEKTQPVFISISRCRNEIVTVNTLKAVDIEHAASFVAANKAADGKDDDDSGGGVATLPGGIQQAKKGTTALQIVLKEGKCELCEATTKLLPISGFNVCVACAQIEFGKRRKAKKKD